MKKQIWKRPPSYGGHRSNKRVLAVFAVMAQGLAVIADDRTVAERLTDIQRKMQYRVGDGGHADVQFFVNTVFEDFLAVRNAMDESDRAELESAMELLESDVKKLSDLIREGVSVTPWDDEMDRRVAKLMQNTASIRTIYKRTLDDLRRMREKRDRVASELLTADQYGVDRERLEMRERRMCTYCLSREKAVKALEDILEELSELISLSHNSPALAGRANRHIRIKQLADFYVHPLKAQQQRERLKSELLYIIRSVEKLDEVTDTWGSVLYDDKTTSTATEGTENLSQERRSSHTDITDTENGFRRKTTAQTDFTGRAKSGANKTLLKEKEGEKNHEF